MKKTLLAVFISLLIALPAFAQTYLTPAEVEEYKNDPNAEIIYHDDGTVEVFKKIHFFEEIEQIINIPPEIFYRENLGYDKPILNSAHIAGPDQISSDPFVIGSNALFAILIFLVVGLACFLFNNVLEAHGEDINKFMKRIPGYGMFEKQTDNKFVRVLILFLMLVLFGIVAAHISPDFNLFEQKNLGILIITIGTIIIATYIKDVLRFIKAKRNGWDAYFKPNVLGLLLAVLCVVLSRTLEIPPGYLFGIPIGLYIFSKDYNKNEGKFEFSSLWLMYILAGVVWFFIPFARNYEILSDLFNLLFVILIEGLFFELFPLAYLPGGAIFKWSKPAWAFIFGVVSFSLLHTLFNPNSTVTALSENAPTLNTLIILGVFVLFCFGVWGIARLKSRNL
ncbi:hypothetical protein ACFL3T_00570 [Patescibacteria group bacterium]